MSLSCLTLALERYDFQVGIELMRDAISRLGIETAPEHALHYRRALPDRNRGASSAPAVMRLP
jgi:hypothetical protein